MRNAPMRFCGFSFHHNPAKLRIDERAGVLRIESQCAEPDSLLLGRRLKIISGEGELYGAECVKQYRSLCRLFTEGKRGLLTLPHMPSVYAYLQELRLIAEPEDDVIAFTFSFIEAKGDGSAVSAESKYTVVNDGESLWDVAYSHGAGIDELVALNPRICDIDDLSAGEEVRIC